MMNSTRLLQAWTVAGVALACALPGTLIAQGTAQASTQDTTKIVLKQLAPAEARTTRAVSSVGSLRALGNGSVFVHDNQSRRVILFDNALGNARVIADTMPGTPIPYGQRQMGMLPYTSDSTVLVDPATNAMLVLNSQGQLVRIMAAPRNNDMFLLASTNLGANAFDSKGQLVYRQGNAGGGPNIGAMLGAAGGGDRGGRGGAPTAGAAAAGARGGNGGARGGGDRGGGGGGGFTGGGFPGGGRGPTGIGQNQPDSLPIVRVNFDTRKADSVAWVRVPKSDVSMTRGDDGSTRISSKINPLPQGDDWVLLSDGTIAVVRVLDYHVDWYGVSGTHTASDRLPFDWKRISDDEKTRMVDSLNVLAKAASERMAAGGNSNFRMSFEVTAAEKLPDYYPPVRAGSSMADMSGNLWILPSTSNLQAQLAQQASSGRGGFGGGPPGGGRGGSTGAAGDSARGRARADSVGGRGAGFLNMLPLSPPAVYDVVNQQGQLVHRVQVPAGKQLVGFGPNGVIYLSVRQGRDVFLEKTRLVN